MSGTVSERRNELSASRCALGHLLQFEIQGIQGTVAPDFRTIARLTSRFRGAVLRELLELKTGATLAAWPRVDTHVRDAIADMAGKDRNNEPLKGNRHTEFLTWCEDGRPTRLLIWRHNRAFDVDEHEAIYTAAGRKVSWAEAGTDPADQRVSLVALQPDVLPPPGFDGQLSTVWESVTPYVPPRHHLRGGKERGGESIVHQIRRELAQRGIAQNVEVDQVGPAVWVQVHIPRRARAAAGSRRAQMVRLTFSSAISGPLRLGHSSSFGLGLFRPAREPHQ